MRAQFLIDFPLSEGEIVCFFLGVILTAGILSIFVHEKSVKNRAGWVAGIAIVILIILSEFVWK